MEQFEQWRPHLIWMDIRMPVMSGLEATRQIRGKKFGSETKIVALTAHALEDERIEILQSGCDDFIRKPYRDFEIYTALSIQLGIRFVYAEKETPLEMDQESELDKDQLSAISPNLIEKLQQGSALLDEELCLKAAGMIGNHNPELGERLRCMVEALQFREILSVLDGISGMKAE